MPFQPYRISNSALVAQAPPLEAHASQALNTHHDSESVGSLSHLIVFRLLNAVVAI